MYQGSTKSFQTENCTSEDILQNYIQKISKFETLDGEKEKYYAKLAKEGDPLAKKILIQANLKLVINVARKSIHISKLPVIDLIQEGNVGLMVAADKFNWRLGYKFSTYATWWIKQAMFKAISEQSYCMKIPVYIQETLSKYKKVKAELEQKYNCEVKSSVVAKEMNLAEDKIDKYLNAYCQSLSLESNNEQDGGKTLSLSEMIEDNKASAQDSVEFEELKKDIENVLSILKDKEKNVILMRFGLRNETPKTLQEIGKIYGVTKECIRQMEKRAIQKICSQKEARELLSCYLI